MATVYQSLVAVEPLTLICTICNLFIQIWVLKKFFLEKVRAVLDARRAAAGAELASARAVRADADAAREEYGRLLAGADARADELLAATQKTADARSAAVLASARAEAERMRAEAGAALARDRARAADELKGEIGALAVALAEKVVEREIRPADHRALIDEFIDRVGRAS